MKLFASRSTKKKKNHSTDAIKASSLAQHRESISSRAHQTRDHVVDPDETNARMYLRGFGGLGLCEWIQRACSNMGFVNPTRVQQFCIPSILEGRDVLGCAQTGSGKTAAFALPILQRLSEDPFGVFGLVLTPTRELAVQIEEQFMALGAPCGVKTCLVIGGLSMLQQSLALAQRPHVVVATPGRLRDHLQGPDPPALGQLKFLVLDEADFLLSMGFQSDLGVILERCPCPARRQTLLFSATLTPALDSLKDMALSDPVLFDLGGPSGQSGEGGKSSSRGQEEGPGESQGQEQRGCPELPRQLVHQYLFMPPQVKVCYLVEALHELGHKRLWTTPAVDKGGHKGAQARRRGRQEDSDEEEPVDGIGEARSAIIFASTCRKCQELCEVLTEVGVGAVALHSLLTQPRRMAALAKFKSQQVGVLVSTDVASRGLDIPSVDLVINHDLPRTPVDYVHRVGRTARAGKGGTAVSLVTPAEVGLVQAAEAYAGVKLEECPQVVQRNVLRRLNPVAKAQRVAKLRLLQQGFEDKVLAMKERKKKFRAKSQAKNKRPHGGESPNRDKKTKKLKNSAQHKESNKTKELKES